MVPQRLRQRRRHRHHHRRRVSVRINVTNWDIICHHKSVNTKTVCKTFIAGLMQAPCGQVGRRLYEGQCGQAQVAIQGLRLVNFCCGRQMSEYKDYVEL